MDVLTIFGTQFVLSLVVFTLIAKWYVAPWLATLSRNRALEALLLPHTLRHLGLVFLVPGLVGDRLDGYFAGAAAYGDLASGLLAIAAVVALHRGSAFALPLTALFNVVGTGDLIHALSQASVVPQLGFTWFIPTFVVPVLLVTHGMMFAKLAHALHGSEDRGAAKLSPAESVG